MMFYICLFYFWSKAMQNPQTGRFGPRWAGMGWLLAGATVGCTSFLGIGELGSTEPGWAKLGGLQDDKNYGTTMAGAQHISNNRFGLASHAWAETRPSKYMVHAYGLRKTCMSILCPLRQDCNWTWHGWETHGKANNWNAINCTVLWSCLYKWYDPALRISSWVSHSLRCGWKKPKKPENSYCNRSFHDSPHVDWMPWVHWVPLWWPKRVRSVECSLTLTPQWSLLQLGNNTMNSGRAWGKPQVSYWGNRWNSVFLFAICQQPSAVLHSFRAGRSVGRLVPRTTPIKLPRFHRRWNCTKMSLSKWRPSFDHWSPSKPVVQPISDAKFCLVAGMPLRIVQRSSLQWHLRIRLVTIEKTTGLPQLGSPWLPLLRSGDFGQLWGKASTATPHTAPSGRNIRKDGKRWDPNMKRHVRHMLLAWYWPSIGLLVFAGLTLTSESPIAVEVELLRLYTYNSHMLIVSCCILLYIVVSCCILLYLVVPGPIVKTLERQHVNMLLKLGRL